MSIITGVVGREVVSPGRLLGTTGELFAVVHTSYRSSFSGARVSHEDS